MPYTIKKKVKKAPTEAPDIEEVRSMFSKVYEERRQAVLGALGAIAAIALIGVFLTVYRSGKVKDSTTLENQALTAYYEATADTEGYDRAVELFRKANDMRTSSLAQVYTAEAYLKTGQPDLARQTYQSLASSKVDTPVASAARLKLALVTLGEDNQEEAIQQFEALQNDTLVGDTALYHLSLIYDAQGMEENKLETFKALAARFPKSPWAPEAIQYVEQASDKQPDAAATPADESAGKAPTGEAQAK